MASQHLTLLIEMFIIGLFAINSPFDIVIPFSVAESFQQADTHNSGALLFDLNETTLIIVSSLLTKPVHDVTLPNKLQHSCQHGSHE